MRKGTLDIRWQIQPDGSLLTWQTRPASPYWGEDDRWQPFLFRDGRIGLATVVGNMIGRIVNEGACCV